MSVKFINIFCIDIFHDNKYYMDTDKTKTKWFKERRNEKSSFLKNGTRNGNEFFLNQLFIYSIFIVNWCQGV